MGIGLPVAVQRGQFHAFEVYGRVVDGVPREAEVSFVVELLFAGNRGDRDSIEEVIVVVHDTLTSENKYY